MPVEWNGICGSVNALFDDGKNLWVGYTFSNLITRFPLNDPNAYEQYVLPELQVDSVSDESVDFMGMVDSVFVVAGRAGLFRYDPKSDSFESIESVDCALRDFVRDRDGNLWVATSNGLVCYDYGTKEHIHYRHDPTDSLSLPTDDVHSMIVDRMGQLIVGLHRAGVVVYDYSTGNFRRGPEQLKSLSVFAMVEDNYDNLWLSTDKGLVRWDRKEGSIRHFYLSDGIQGNLFTPRSAMVDQRGRVWFGGIAGFNIIDPALLNDKQIAPKVLIVNFDVLNESKDDDDDFCAFGVNFSDTVDLEYDQNVIGFDIVVASNLSPQHNRYTYMLKGYDKDWIEGEGDCHVSYNLRPGRYELVVRGANSDGVWSTDQTTVAIRVKQRFFNTPFMWILSVIFLLCIVWLTIDIARNIAVNNHKNELLEYQLKKDNEAFESKITFFTDVVHAIPNGCTCWSTNCWISRVSTTTAK